MELPVSLNVLGFAYGIVFVGAILQGSIGFGLGTLSVPILLLVDPVFVPGPLLFLAFMLTLSVYFRDRGAVRTQDLKWGVAGRLAGTVAGTLLLFFLPQDYVAPLIALLVLVALIVVYSGFQLPITTRTLLGVGALSGFMGTTASIGGPPMAMLYYGQAGPRIRGTLSGIFIFGTLMALIGLAAIGRFRLPELVLGLSLTPALFAGFWASRYAARALDRGYIRPAIFGVSGTAALISLVRYLV